MLGELLELGPAGAETSAQGGLGVQPACPEDVESFYSEGFVKSLGVYGIEDLGRIIVSLCLKALLASCATVSGAKRDETKFLARSSDNLRLEENGRLKKENEALENLHNSLMSRNDLLNEKVTEQEDVIQKMQEKIELDEGVLDNLRGTIDRDNTKIVNLQTEVRQLKVDVEKKNELISKLEKEAEEDRETWVVASHEIVAKSAAIREEFQKALATFGAEPSPFPKEAEEKLTRCCINKNEQNHRRLCLPYCCKPRKHHAIAASRHLQPAVATTACICEPSTSSRLEDCRTALAPPPLSGIWES